MNLEESDTCTFETAAFGMPSSFPRKVRLISPASVQQNTEAEVVEYCSRNVSANEVFVDAGAHIGWYSLPLSGVFEKCYAFEPSDFQYELLCQNITGNRISNVKSMKFGLGSSCEEKEFYITGKSGGTNTFMKNSYSENPMSTCKVQIRDLDSFKYENVSFIKIDVEGWELEVLKGSLETINQSTPEMLIEVWEDTKRRQEIEDFLAKLNYKIDYRFKEFPELGWASKH